MESDDKLQALISKLQEKEKQELIEFLSTYFDDQKGYTTRRTYFLVNPMLIEN